MLSLTELPWARDKSITERIFRGSCRISSISTGVPTGDRSCFLFCLICFSMPSFVSLSFNFSSASLLRKRGKFPAVMPLFRLRILYEGRFFKPLAYIFRQADIFFNFLIRGFQDDDEIAHAAEVINKIYKGIYYRVFCRQGIHDIGLNVYPEYEDGG